MSSKPSNKKLLKVFEAAKEATASKANPSIDELLSTTELIKPTGIDFSGVTDLKYIEVRKHLSFSELSSWMGCAWKHKIKYLDGVIVEGDGPSEHTDFGHVIHGALEVFLETRQMPSIDSLKADLTERFSKLPNGDKLKPAEWHDVIEPILKEVPAFMDETFGPSWEFIASEFPLMEPIEGQNHLFKGFIDGVIRDSKGVVHLIDWKTCSYFWPVSKRIDPGKTYQLVFYKYFYAKKHGLDLSDVKCSFVLLRRSSKPGNCQLVPVSVGEKAVKNALETIDRMLGHIQRKMFPKNRDNCRFCPYAGTVHCP